ncbi:MAG: four helix bundle protein [Bacteroidales bacterium]|nr:four helix bundle protein [Bacteroidales bacterium]MEE0992004.1 four helix bundle protein [Bacteroidales bacterium]
MRDFRQYEVWNKAIAFTTEVYKLTIAFPVSEKFGLANQLQRAAVSIASNIAEGASRTSEKDFALSLGSSFEIETQLLISRNLNYISEIEYMQIMNELTILQKQLNNFINRIRSNN